MNEDHLVVSLITLVTLGTDATKARRKLVASQICWVRRLAEVPDAPAL